MARLARTIGITLVGLIAGPASPLGAAPEDPPPPKPAAPAEGPKEAPEILARRKEKARKFLEASGWLEATRAVIEKSLENAVQPEVLEKFRKVAKWEALLDVAAEIQAEKTDEETLDAAIAFYGTPAGKRLARSRVATEPEVQQEIQAWAMEALAETTEREAGAVVRAAMQGAKVHSQETAAWATLKSLTAAQATIQNQGIIDADKDGIGEYGTFLELLGSVGVRNSYSPMDGDRPASSGFDKQGGKVTPAIISVSLGEVDTDGIVVKSGYCFRVFLPDASTTAKWVHEAGPAEKVGLAGGTGTVGVDCAETVWCAYAWPLERGKTGNRVFFVNQACDVIESSNEVAKWEGKVRPPKPDSAFKGSGITSPIAIGTTGNDGDVWTVR